MAASTEEQLTRALWRIYRRPERPTLWQADGNLPWNNPDFSQRMLREHLDQSHDAASRRSEERTLQIDWLWDKLRLGVGSRVLDITCGPGLYAVELAKRGCVVTGIDFSPASISYARELAVQAKVASTCTFVEQDVRRYSPEPGMYDAVLFLYGQLAVFRRIEAATLLARLARSLKTGGGLLVELLDQTRVDKQPSTWWFTDDTGLWGDAPFLHLGERFWDAEQALSIERFQTLQLATGELDEIVLCDQTYAIEEMRTILSQAGFATVEVYPSWGGLPLHDAQEWVTYIAHR